MIAPKRDEDRANGRYLICQLAGNAKVRNYFALEAELNPVCRKSMCDGELTNFGLGSSLLELITDFLRPGLHYCEAVGVLVY